MANISINIKDIKWSFDVLSDSEYEKKHGTSSHGITDKEKLEVDFKLSSFSLRLIRHELFHTYVASCCINSIDEFDEHSMEELGAEIVEFHLDDLVKISKKIEKDLGRKYKQLLQAKKEANESSRED